MLISNAEDIARHSDVHCMTLLLRVVSSRSIFPANGNHTMKMDYRTIALLACAAVVFERGRSTRLHRRSRDVCDNSVACGEVIIHPVAHLRSVSRCTAWSPGMGSVDQ
jgi:hypothetical protein